MQLLLVEAYQHLGNMVVHTGSAVPCIQSRVRAAAGVFERLSATLFRNVEVTTAEKRTLLESMLLRKLYFGAGLWTLCTKHERSFFSSNLHRDSEVCAAIGVLLPTEIQICELVPHLSAVAEHGDGFLWDCVLAERMWLDLACQAFEAVTKVAAKGWLVGVSDLKLLQALQGTQR